MAISKINNGPVLDRTNWWSKPQYISTNKNNSEVNIGDYVNQAQFVLNDKFLCEIHPRKATNDNYDLYIDIVRNLIVNSQKVFVNSDIAIETVSLGTNLSFSADEVKSFTIPSKTGYSIKALLSPIVSGDWHDKYAVVMAYSNGFGIWNRDTNARTWSVSANVLYMKDMSV